MSTGPRRVVIGKLHTSKQNFIPALDQVLPTEIDNHTDTHCFDANFILFTWTCMECTVSPFLDEYDSQENIPICSGATAYTGDNGKTVILIFGQGLWFGERLNKSIINPNQCRAY